MKLGSKALVRGSGSFYFRFFSFKIGFLAPWDSESGTPRPPLLELIEEKKYAIPADGRAIVPGCGRG